MLGETLPESSTHLQLPEFVWYGFLLCLLAGLAWSVHRYRQRSSDQLLSIAVFLSICSVLMFFAPTYNLRSAADPSWLHQYYFSQVNIPLTLARILWYVCVLSLLVVAVLSCRKRLKQPDQSPIKVPITILSLLFLVLALPGVVEIGVDTQAWCRSIECAR